MTRKNGKVHLTKEQIEYLLMKTGAQSTQEAFELLSAAMVAEKVDPLRMPEYLNKMMEKDGLR